MSTRVKIAIAAAIVAALVGLIVLDQRTAAGQKNVVPETPPASPASPTDGASGGFDIRSDLQNGINQATGELNRALGQSILQPDPAPATEPASNQPAVVAPPTPPPAAPESYVVREGDTMSSIAEARYGSRNKWELIAKANPTVKPSRMRAGTKIVIPPANAPAVAPVDGTQAPNAEPVVENGRRYHVIAANDSLHSIAKKHFNDARMAEKIFEANRDVLDNADHLVIGVKLALPDAPAPRDEPAVTVPPEGAATDTPGGARTYRVKSGDSLWKIAKAHANGRALSEVMERIRDANGARLPSLDTPLQVDWVITIPE